MVFLIQATQNRDAEAIQIKLDEIIHRGAGHQVKLTAVVLAPHTSTPIFFCAG